MIPCTKILSGTKTVHSGVSMGPLFIWNITNKCNLKCEHCYGNSDINSPHPELTDEKCIQLIEEIKKLNPPIVLLTGGEPLLRNNVLDIAKKCKQANLRVGLSTNGTIIDEDMAKKIKESKIDYVGISIDGTEKLHDEFRGCEGSFNKSWAAIKHLENLGVKTGVRFTLTDKNKNELFSVLDKTFKSGAKRFCLYHLVYSGRGKDVTDISLPEKRQIMDKFFARVGQLAALDNQFEVLTTDNHADGVYMLANLSNNEGARSCIEAHKGCSAGDKVFYLDSTGEVYPCQFLKDKSLGNVTQGRLFDIVKNKNNTFLNQLKNKQDFVQGKCNKCTHKDICGGCRARAKARSGSFWAEDPACYLNEDEMLVSNQMTK